jgi:hypothetical protein
MGLGVTELMDTVYAHDLRPSEYAKKQRARTKQWIQRVKSRLAERPDDQDAEPMPVIATEPWRREEWAELDMELQIAASQEQMSDWEAPIFNREQGARQAIAATTPDSIDEEVEEHLALARGGVRPAPKAPEPTEEQGSAACLWCLLI